MSKNNMSRKIFLIQKDNNLTPLTEEMYLTEDRFQTLLEKYPDLLAGDQMDEDNPRRWLLVSREVGIPGEEEGSGRWSLDHLFLDQDAIPTLVEVKRSTDSRIRREVVGQILDYAANAVVYWPVEDIKAKFEANCDKNKEDPNILIQDLLGLEQTEEISIEGFWEDVRTNLKAGKIRLVFVADEIPKELKRIVEFLNSQMDPAEVLAVEIKQFVGQDIQTLVPKVIGNISSSDKKKAGRRSEGKQWDETSFFKELEERKGTDEVAVARKIYKWAKEKMNEIWWGRGKKMGGFVPGLVINDDWYQFFEVWTYGSIEIQFQYLKSWSDLFESKESRLELLSKLNSIEGIQLSDDVIERRPSLQLSIFKEKKKLEELFKIFDWILEKIISE